MQQNIKQHTLTYEQGLTSVPSDITSPDNALSEADGLVYLDGEYKPLQNPELHREDIEGTIKYVHLLNDGTKHYLSENQDIYVYSENGVFIEAIWMSVDVYKIAAVGNTLIVNTSKGICYYLWGYSESLKKTTYIDLGYTIPFPEIDFALKKASTKITKNGVLPTSTDSTTVAQEDRNNYYIGLYASAKHTMKTKRGFCEPFFVRYAIELYDGSYTLPSAPILLYPGIHANHYFATNQILLTYCTLLYSFRNNTDYSQWKDIVKDIVVFASEPVDIYDTTDDCSAVKLSYSLVWDGVVLDNGYFKYQFDVEGIPDDAKRTAIPKVDEAQVKEELENTSLFYKIMSLGIINSASTVWQNASDKIKKHTLENLTTQERLSNDYYSHCSIYPSSNSIETFNRRLNTYNVSRGFFNGFRQFFVMNAFEYEGNTGGRGSTTNAGKELTYYVHIKTPNGDVITRETATRNTIFGKGYWFFYPDPRAYQVDVFCSSGKIHSCSLKEHTGLNGAYCLNEIPGEGDIMSDTAVAATAPTVVANQKEVLQNFLLQSETDNPFTFRASGYVRVGQGTIIGMAGLTTALSQDAYKISTTLVFTTQGIWALKINDTGQYSSVAPPFSREVCSCPKTITMTDNAVFFISKKGLMCVTGESESSVVCVSKNLKDSAFVTYCNSSLCRIAYDYKEQLLYVMQIDSDDAYIYSISTGTWTYDSNVFGGANNLLSVVTDYPDTYIQEESSNIYSFLSRHNRNNDIYTYSGTITTRPLKLSGSLIPESIRRIKQLVHPGIKVHTSASSFNSSSQPSMLMTIKGSNNLTSWYDVDSTGGKPFRFFKLKYQFKNLSATHTFAATVLLTQQRHTNRFI